MAKQFVRPGDLILIKTPGPFYGVMRKLFGSAYDHTVVVVDEERSLHIAYPKAKLVPTFIFMHILREPLVLRLNIFQTKRTEDQVKKELFLFSIKHAAIGKRYDAAKVFYFLRMNLRDKVVQSQAASLTSRVIQKAKGRLSKIYTRRSPEEDSKVPSDEGSLIVLKQSPAPHGPPKESKVICSHTIMSELCKNIPEVGSAVLLDEMAKFQKLDFYNYGTFSPRDVEQIATTLSPQMFMTVKPYTDKEIQLAKLFQKQVKTPSAVTRLS